MSGLTKRVPGANAPKASKAAHVGSEGSEGTLVRQASVDVVTSLLEHLSSDLERERDR